MAEVLKEQIGFTREKETKNAVRFTEDAEAGKPPKVGTLYLQKWFIGDVRTIRVTIETA